MRAKSCLFEIASSDNSSRRHPGRVIVGSKGIGTGANDVTGPQGGGPDAAHSADQARVQIAAGTALGIFFLMLQTLVFLTISGGIVLAAGGAAVYAMQQRRTA
jgi:hypothetical protein